MKSGRLDGSSETICDVSAGRRVVYEMRYKESTPSFVASQLKQQLVGDAHMSPPVC